MIASDRRAVRKRLVPANRSFQARVCSARSSENEAMLRICGGATTLQFRRPRGASSLRFNPRAREGRDFRRLRCADPECGRFNPRAREGRDKDSNSGELKEETVSIHAPARGATPSRCRCSRSRSGFNPRAREGRDGRT
jgi:hypothetical protein